MAALVVHSYWSTWTYAISLFSLFFLYNDIVNTISDAFLRTGYYATLQKTRSCHVGPLLIDKTCRAACAALCYSILCSMHSFSPSTMVSINCVRPNVARVLLLLWNIKHKKIHYLSLFLQMTQLKGQYSMLELNGRFCFQTGAFEGRTNIDTHFRCSIPRNTFSPEMISSGKLNGSVPLYFNLNSRFDSGERHRPNAWYLGLISNDFLFSSINRRTFNSMHR